MLFYALLFLFGWKFYQKFGLFTCNYLIIRFNTSLCKNWKFQSNFSYLRNVIAVRCSIVITYRIILKGIFPSMDVPKKANELYLSYFSKLPVDSFIRSLNRSENREQTCSLIKQSEYGIVHSKRIVLIKLSLKSSEIYRGNKFDSAPI